MYALLAKKVSPPEWRALWSRMRTAETSPHSPLHPHPLPKLAVWPQQAMWPPDPHLTKHNVFDIHSHYCVYQ